jgi:hypothetical protein
MQLSQFGQCQNLGNSASPHSVAQRDADHWKILFHLRKWNRIPQHACGIPPSAHGTRQPLRFSLGQSILGI